jgi:hypothetical protein
MAARGLVRLAGMTRGISARLQTPLVARFATHSDPNFDPYSNKQQSDAIFRIARVPVIEVDANIAICNGGGGATGELMSGCG